MRPEAVEHPAAVRLSHWVAAGAVAVLVMSGLEIFAAFPSFGGKIPQHDLLALPEAIRLGGWLGGALQWHVTFAALLMAAGFAYAVYEAASGNYRQVLFACRDLAGVWPMVRHYVLRAPKPVVRGTYNPLQKLAYTAALALGFILAVTGMALYKPVQLSWLVTALGGFGMVRVWHFAAMCGLLAFIPGHLVMVALHGWRNFVSMWVGTRA
ncbi:MAG TPA: cytochrome b/b6 domain-containing protein [Vicinamibacterales bacterium]|nr:cytochrome b/b6 domain-containing protein [Vicinamibacterales bacterium]